MRMRRAAFSQEQDIIKACAESLQSEAEEEITARAGRLLSSAKERLTAYADRLHTREDARDDERQVFRAANAIQRQTRVCGYCNALKVFSQEADGPR